MLTSPLALMGGRLNLEAAMQYWQLALAKFAQAVAPASIFHWSYLLSAYGLALAWLVGQERYPLTQAWALIHARKTWISRSSRLDLMLTLGFLLALAEPIAALEQRAFLASLARVGNALSQIYPAALTVNASPLIEAILATLAAMLAIDLSSYLVHRALHRVPWLWRLHAVHHSATALTPLTTYRQHPLEPVLLNTGRGIGAGIGLALFYTVFPQHTAVITISGLGAGFFVYMFTVNLHHAPVPLRYPEWLRLGLISPHVHHLHHSAAARHAACNYGVVFSFWDRVLNTYLDEASMPGELRFGLGAPDPFNHSIVRSLTLPRWQGGLPTATAAHARGRR